MKISKIIALYSLLIILLLTFFCSKETPESIVAKAGKTSIPYSEFHERFEFTPQIMMTEDKIRNKRLVLFSLLGEKILVEEARKKKLHKNDKYLTFTEEMKKEALVEKLFEEEVISKIEVSEQELRQGYLRSLSKLNIQVLTFDNEQLAMVAKKQINEGKSLTQVKQDLQTDAFISTDSVLTVEMEWGQAHPKLEDVAYSLKPNQVSDPVFADGTYFIIKLINRTNNIFVTENGFAKQAPSIKKKILRRRRAELFQEYMGNLMADKKVRVSHEVFDMVAGFLEKETNVPDSITRTNPKTRDLATDINKSTDLTDHMNDTFARFDDGSTWTISDLLKKLSVGPYRLNYKSKKSFRNSLRLAVRQMIEFETLAKRGKSLGLENSYYVKYQTKMWGDSYLGQLMRQSITDTVTISNDEIQNYYQTHKQDYRKPEMVNLHEILVENKKLADEIYRRAKNGEDLSRLARKYNTRQISIKTDGVTGYFATHALGIIGETAGKMEIGQLSRPVKTNKGQYSVFKVLDKKPAGPAPIQEVWEKVRSEALAEKKLHALDNYLANLTQKYKVEINKAVFDTLTTYDLNMLVMKKHYANRAAAPMVTPLHQAQQWQKQMNFVYPRKK